MATEIDYTRKCQQLDLLIDLLEKENRRLQAEKRIWIPVTERLPEVGQRVLAQQKDGSSRACRCIDGGHLAWFYADTVAWMPLPEPYKESEVAT